MTPTLIKALEDLKAFFVKQAEQPALKSATLADGTEIKYAGDLIAGTAVTMVTPDGEVPAQGDLTLADGTIVKCDAGVVTEVIAPTDMTAIQQMKVLQEKLKVNQASIEERLANLEAIAKATMEYCYGWDMRHEQQEANLEAATAAYQALAGLAPAVTSIAEGTTAMSQAIETLQSEVEALKAKPAAKPVFVPADSTDEFLQKEVERVKSIQNKTKK